MLMIIPKPVRAEETGGVLTLGKTVCQTGAFPETQQYAAALLASLCGVQTAQDGTAMQFCEDASLEKEEYRLTVTETGVTVTASMEAGAFYAVQTLRQIGRFDLDKNAEIPCCEIADKPRFAYRGFMMDEARHFFGMEHVKQTLRMMAMLKMNRFHWHLTDDQGWRIEIKQYPELTKIGAVRQSTQLTPNPKGPREHKPYGEGLFYTQEQIKEIVAYAAKLHIEIIPEVDMPGHLTAAIACYPELSCFRENVVTGEDWGIIETIGCAGREELYTFAKNVIDEISGLFPGGYFHIGGDEAPKAKWKKCPACQAKIKTLGLKNEDALQGYFTTEMLRYLKTKNKALVGWNEILESANLDDDTIVQWWVGDGRKNGVNDWLEKGNRVILSHCDTEYMDYFYSMKPLDGTYNFDLERMGLDSRYEPQVLGIEAPMWAEYARSIAKFEFNVYPRMQALAESAWTPKTQKNFEDFRVRLQEFLKVLDHYGIGYANEEASLCTGADGKRRKLTKDSDWKEDPNKEFLRFAHKK